MLQMFMYPVSLLLVPPNVFLLVIQLVKKPNNLYDIETNKVFTSRDVIFHEDIIPYESISLSPTKTDSVLPIVVLDSSPI